MGKEKDQSKKSQQAPQDPERQNAKHEREYREQKQGDKKKPPSRATDEEAIDDYIDIAKKDPRKKRDLE